MSTKILYIEDNPDNRMLVRRVLQAEGYTVAEIAELSGEPRGTILARLSRSRAELSLRMIQAGLVAEAIPASVEEKT